MKILFILTLCFYINVEAQCKSNKSIYGNAISVLYEKLLKDEVLEKTDTLYLILDEKANLNKEQDKISKYISFKVPFLRLGESSPIYKMNPYLIYKKNRVSKWSKLFIYISTNMVIFLFYRKSKLWNQ